LGSDNNRDLSHRIWKQKQHHWANINITIVTLSHWLGQCVKKSSLFRSNRVELIPNGIDTNIYKPIDTKTARDILNLPQDKKLILFGAMSVTSDPRKGFPFLASALEKLAYQDQEHNFELVIFGASHPSNDSDFPFKAHYLGKLADDISLALIYSAVDVFVAPSVEDNLPNTVMEALACGTPCVSFKIGGMSDMIEHENNGYLANAFSVDELIQGISWALENGDLTSKLSENARKTVEEKFTLKHQAEKYLELYQDILGGVNEKERQSR
jgi:glycosyltransferase involved in cell wall biosynthesis